LDYPDLMNEFLLEGFPNPERKGCPDENTLKAFAEKRIPANDPVGLHVASCSECYAEYRHYRLDWITAHPPATGDPAPIRPTSLKAPIANSSSRRLLAFAASILLVVGAAIAYRYEHKVSGSTHVWSAQPTYAKVDLFEAPTVRGAQDQTAPLSNKVTLPAAMVDLTITLPRYSAGGRYTVRVAQDKAGTQRIAEAEGTTSQENQKTLLTVTLDLRNAKAGSYFLATIRASDNGAYYYPLQVR